MPERVKSWRAEVWRGWSILHENGQFVKEPDGTPCKYATKKQARIESFPDESVVRVTITVDARRKGKKRG